MAENTPLKGVIDVPALTKTAQALVANGKGILAMDESIGTCNQRFADTHIPQTTEMRRAYRELLLTAPGLNGYISGVILVDETIRQSTASGTPFIRVATDAGLLIGIKVDVGAKDFAAHAGEKVTEGLDGLRERLDAYFAMGARFAKWRGVIAVDDVQLPTSACIEANNHALARYAGLCQERGLVPIIEPEMLMEGSHTQQRCGEVTEAVLSNLFRQLALQGVVPEAIILKPNMVIAGLSCPTQNTTTQVADATLNCLLRVVPAAVPGIVFLSGGQPGELASSRLNAMQPKDSLQAKNNLQVNNDQQTAKAATGTVTHRRALPWPLSFSFARALQHPALDIWAGTNTNRVAAQQALLHRARCNCAAVNGEYSPAMELQG